MKTNKEIMVEEISRFVDIHWADESLAKIIDESSIEYFVDILLSKLQVLDRIEVEKIIKIHRSSIEHDQKSVFTYIGLKNIVTAICQLIPKEDKGVVREEELGNNAEELKEYNEDLYDMYDGK